MFYVVSAMAEADLIIVFIVKIIFPFLSLSAAATQTFAQGCYCKTGSVETKTETRRADTGRDQ
jgi:hypothetical protein